MMQAGDTIVIDLRTRPDLLRKGASRTGVITGFLPEKYKHWTDSIKRATVDNIRLIWARMDSGHEVGLGFGSIVSINGYPKPKRFRG